MRWLSLWLAVLALVVAATAFALAQVPQPCIELASRHHRPIPRTEAEAKAAKWEINWRAAFGDKLAKQCRDALKAELRK